VIPRLWPGSTVVILASGPSLTVEDVDACRGRARVVAVNNTAFLAPWADAMYAMDKCWWRVYGPRLTGFAGLKFCGYRESEAYGARWISGRDGKGLSADNAFVRYGGNSGFQALNLAYHFGAARVILLGFDCQGREGVRHYFGDHPEPLGNPTQAAFARWIRAFREAAIDLRGTGCEVVNATRSTAIDAFPRLTLEEALCGR